MHQFEINSIIYMTYLLNHFIFHKLKISLLPINLNANNKTLMINVYLNYKYLMV